MKTNIFDSKSVLITGGTGSLGQALTETILNRWPNVERLIVYSQYELAINMNSAIVRKIKEFYQIKT